MTGMEREAMRQRARKPKDRKERELAAIWCSILAHDRARDAWTFKIHAPHEGPPALRLAWRYWLLARLEALHVGAYDTRAEHWARTESILRGGPLP